MSEASEAPGSAAYEAPGDGPEKSTSGGYKAVPEPRRSSPPRSETRARSQVVTVRIDDDERERWAAFAHRKGMSLAGLLRLSVEAALLQDELRGTER